MYFFAAYAYAAYFFKCYLLSMRVYELSVYCELIMEARRLVSMCEGGGAIVCICMYFVCPCLMHCCICLGHPRYTNGRQLHNTLD